MTLTDKDGDKYTGTITSSSNTGTFTYTRHDGRKWVYVGEHSNGMFNGKGLWKEPEGHTWEGEWSNSKPKKGVCVRTFPEGGRWLYLCESGISSKITKGV